MPFSRYTTAMDPNNTVLYRGFQSPRKKDFGVGIFTQNLNWNLLLNLQWCCSDANNAKLDIYPCLVAPQTFKIVTVNWRKQRFCTTVQTLYSCNAFFKTVRIFISSTYCRV